MKITINGNNIINGRIGGGGYSSVELKKVNETKRNKAEGISKIKVESDCANVTVSTINSTDAKGPYYGEAYVEAHYFGEVYTDGKPELKVTTTGDEISITVKNKGNIVNGSLELNVRIPQRVFRSISVKTRNGSVGICKDVETKWLRIDSQNGRIVSEATFEEITAKSMNGSIDICTRAKNDIEVNASSMNGSVFVELENIGSCNFSTSSMNGTVRNKNHSTGSYKATGEISSMNGDVKIW